MSTQGMAAAVVVAGVIVAGTAVVATAHEPVAMVSLAEGTVISAENVDEPRTLAVGSCLSQGTRIEVGADSMAQIVFFEGHRFELGALVSATVTGDGLDDVVGEPRRLENVPIGPAIAALAEKAGSRTAVTRVRRADDKESARPWLSPGQNEVVLADEVVLRFSPQKGAERYRVRIRNGETVLEVRTRLTSVAVPAGVLDPEHSYYWTVEPVGPVPLPGREGVVFCTLAQDLAEERAVLVDLLQDHEDPGLKAFIAQLDCWMGLDWESK